MCGYMPEKQYALGTFMDVDGAFNRTKCAAAILEDLERCNVGKAMI